MFAILETGSKQYKVEEGDVLEVELLDQDKISTANTIDFDSVLLIKDKELHIGQPFVTDARIQAKVLEEFKSPKVIIFKKKAKKQYKRTRGHRQKLHLIQIEKIEINPDKAAKPAKDVEPAKDVKEVSETPKPAAKETKTKAPAAKEKEVKTQVQEKKKAPAAKEKEVKTKVQEKKKAPAAKEKQVKTQSKKETETKPATETPTEKPAGKEKEKE